MCKKLIYLASMVNVLNLEVYKTYSILSAGKASLFRVFVLAVFLSVACSLLTAMPVAYGEEGFALEVNGGSVTIDDDEDALRLSSYTYEFWMKDLQGPTGSWRNVFCKGPGDTAAGRGPLLALHPDDPGLHFSHSTGTTQETANTLEGIPVNEWTHIALVLTALNGEQIIYQDGVQVVAESVSSLTDATQSSVLRIGLGANVVLDDFRIWNYARTQEEIQADMNREIFGVEEGLVGYWRFNEGEGTTAYDMSPYENHGNITAPAWTKEAAPITPGTPPVFASRPDPANGALYADTWVNLSWRPGDFALSHDVYFGENFDDVNDGTGDTFQGNHASIYFMVGFLGFPYPDGLVPGTTYYWRIDEVNDTEPNSPWKGPVWSFWIPPRKAYEPAPPDGAKYIDQNVILSWTTGFGAKFHTVYFGDNFDDVNNAAGGIPQTATTYTPGTVELEKTYYWRVDEFDGLVTYKGDLWSFKTLPEIPITDPNLVGWWKFDEGSGTTVLDRSGHGNHGTLRGDPQWVVGYAADALMFDGVNDWVEIPHAEILTVDSEVTVMAWINTERYIGPTGDDWQGIMAKGPNPDRSYSLYTQVSGVLHFSTGGVGTLSTMQVPLNEWVHVAAQVINGGHQYYINGEPAGTSGSGITLPGAADTNPVRIGRTADDNREFLGMIDDVRIYNKALTQDEIEQVMRSDPTLAWGPSPANGSTPYIRDVTPLSWSPGDSVSQHDIYFGTDRDAVADADESDTTGVYRGRQGVTFYTPPEGVEWGGGPYYWRIDEYNTDATISKGNIWSFTVADFIVIDDIEDYNDYPPDEIFSTWIDGWEVPTNGSLAGHPDPPFAETGNVHGGRQSMPVYYENNFKYSEATMTLSYPRNWTEEGVGVLSLWFYGDASNAVERMYVALNGIATVYHDNPNAPLIEEWTEWRIDLQDFAAQGVNLTNVNTISIGFGDKNNLRAGGSGMVLFDDIRLYRPPAP
jgi:hypothetical protein